MELGILEQKEIQSYFRLDSRIARAEGRIRRLRESFYDQTMATHLETDGLEIITVGFRSENKVVAFLDTVSDIETAIGILKKKKQYLHDYLNSLDPGEREYLITRYTAKKFIHEKTDQAVINLYGEIQEIHEAVNYMYGFTPGEREIITRLDNETLENDFEAIAEALGV